MPILLLPAIAAHIAAAENAVGPLDEGSFSAELDALVGDAGALTDDERRGCLAEIVGLRFGGLGTNDGGPWNIYFAPMASGTLSDGTNVYRPDARWMDKEIIAYWQLRAQQSPHPILRARYADLALEIGRLWNRDHHDLEPIDLPRSLSQRAAAAYLESVDGGLATDMHQGWRFLDRALDLSLFVRDQALVERAKLAAFAYYRALVASGKPTTWRKIDDMVWDRKGLALTEGERNEIVAWLQDALNVHANIDDSERFDPHQCLDAADRLNRWHRKAGNADQGIAAIKTAGGVFEASAQQADAITAIAWLENLSLRYRSAKLMDDAARVEAVIRKRGGDAQQLMKGMEVRFEVPREEMDAWLEEITADSLDLSLARIAVNVMTSEDQLRDLVESSAVNAPIQAHIPVAVMGTSGFTTARIGTVKDDMPGRILSLAATMIGSCAMFLHHAFERTKSKHHLDADNLFAFLTQSCFFPEHTHGLLKDGIDAWFSEDWLKAIHVLVPQVEAALREMLVAMGDSAMKPDLDGGGFEVFGMGKVLSAEPFKTNFHPTARLHLRALYTDPKGINLRNKLAHGLAGPDLLGRGICNWVIHSLLVVRVYGGLKDAT